MSTLIGLGHRSGHGKDTVAGYMKEWFNFMRPDLSVVVHPWAKKLKEICYDLYKQYGHREPEYYDTPEGRLARTFKLPTLNKTVVDLWVDLGEGVRDKVYEHTWRDFVRDNIDKDIIILPDTRKPTELEICHFKILVFNPRIPNREGKSIDHELAHYVGWDYTIDNNMGYSELRGQANSVCYSIEKRLDAPVHVSFTGTLKEGM